MNKFFQNTSLKLFILLPFFLLMVQGSYANNRETRQLLDSLDHTLSLRDIYSQKREARISTLSQLAHKNFLTDKQRFDINEQLASEYKSYICDSALHYLSLNLDIAEKEKDVVKIDRTKMQLAHILSMSGMYQESMELLNSISRSRLSPEQIKDYYNQKYILFGELAQYTRYEKARTLYEKSSWLYRDSLLKVLDSNNDIYLQIKEGRMRSNKRYAEALKINDRRLAIVSTNSSQYAVVTFFRALNYQAMGNREAYKQSLILSAMADIRGSIKDNTSLRLLANRLYHEGDIDRASRYIRYSMEDAKFFNAKLRSVQLSTTLPIITEAYQKKIDLHITRLSQMIFLISLLLLVLVAIVFYVFKQKRRLEESRNTLQVANEQLRRLTTDLDQMNQQLQKVNQEVIEANYIKENYIARFLSMSSSYLGRIEGLSMAIKKRSRDVNSKILADLSKSGTMTENELNEFYENFDNSFLNIYPTFIEEFNKLLTDEGQIVLEEHGEKKVLNTELRVFALIRLGFQDSATIAKMLRYSVNTIYNVKAQVKNRAKVSRQDFESLVRKIGSFNN